MVENFYYKSDVWGNFAFGYFFMKTMRISQKTIQAVQDIVCIEQVIGDFVPLKKKGQNYWACCPFHHEKTPSFSVSAARGFYKCFGCDASGDVISFLQAKEGYTFVEAIGYLANRYGIAVEFDDQEDEHQNQLVDDLYHVLNLSRDYYVQLLHEHPQAKQLALPYLEARDITSDVAEKFQLGYSLDQWDGFCQYASQRGINRDLLVESGLVIDNQGKRYDRFRKRIMFPICSSTGQVVAFGARSIDEQSGSKYINSPESLIYHKGNLLYGLHLAKQSIKRMQNCYLVEGYFDVLAFHMAGLDHAVASAGTALTEAQMATLNRFTSMVTLVFDGDQAGIQATLRGIDKLLQQGFHTKVVVLPQGEDPASYLAKVGVEAFGRYICDHTEDFIFFKARYLLDKDTMNDPLKQAQAIRSIVQSIAYIPGDIEHALFIKQCSQLFDIQEEVIWSTYRQLQLVKPVGGVNGKKKHHSRHASGGNFHPKSKDITFKDKVLSSIESYEREIMRIMLLYGSVKITEERSLYAYILHELDGIVFKSVDIKLIFDYFCSALEGGRVVDLSHCLSLEDGDIKRVAINLVASAHDLSPVWRQKYGILIPNEEENFYQVVKEVILKLKMRLLQEEIERNRQRLQGISDLHEEIALLEKHRLLKERECDLAKQLGIVVM